MPIRRQEKKKPSCEGFFFTLVAGFRCFYSTFRGIYGIAVFIFIADGGDGLYYFYFTVTAHAGPCRDEFTDNDVFFKA